MKALALVSTLFVVLVAGGHSAPMKATLVVDDDGRATQNNCNADGFAFDTIQEAVDFAYRNTTIKVCPGTYPEQVTVLKNKIRLQSTQLHQAIVKAPAAMDGDLVTFTGGSKGGLLSKFTVSGPLPDDQFCSESLRSGVRVTGSAQAKIQRNHITEIRAASEELRGCQNGFGIAVGRDFEGQVGNATITDNVIDLYQKGGIYVDGPGTKSTITGNTITGVGPDPRIAANGVQISRNAIAKFTGNTVTDNIYTVGDFSASGLITFQANGDSSFSRNTFLRNDVNVDVFDSVGLLFKSNRADNGTYNGFWVEADTANNRFELNTAHGNALLDCEDDSTGGGTAGTANTWVNNEGDTSDPPAICQPDGGDERRSGRAPARVSPAR